MRIGRRGFLKTSAATALLLASGTLLSGCVSGSFAHGIASGDPRHDGILIWTRITPDEEAEVPVVWEVARDAAFTQRVAGGIITTDHTVDYTVKVDVCGLHAGQRYFYRFRTAKQQSPVGSTRTLPRGNVEQARIAVTSCAHYAQGHFHVYQELAAQTDLDFVLHLGDYLYEVASNSQAVRTLLPEHELRTLSDYRQRYAYYRLDASLQAAHAQHAFVLVWDDHELSNNAWRTGALGHSASEGDYELRREAAMQAYYEWLPVREPSDGDRTRLFRTLRFGSLFSLHVLDTRHYARERALDIRSYVDTQTGQLNSTGLFADIAAPRALLGSEQQTFLTQQLDNEATWQLIGQQVLSARMWLPAPLALRQTTFAQYAALRALAQTQPQALTAAQRRILAAPAIPYNLDAWDGYAAEQRWLVDTAFANVANPIVLAGDTHNAWASDLLASDGSAAGVELATPSVSSRGLEELLAPQAPDDVAQGALALIDTLRFAEAEHRGYLLLHIDHEAVRATFRFVDTVQQPAYRVLSERERQLTVLAGERKLSPTV